jgi:hypothetical protein
VLEDVNAVHSLHSEVSDDDVEFLLVESGERLGGIQEDLDLEARLGLIASASFSAPSSSVAFSAGAAFSDLTTMIFSRASLVFLMISSPVALKPRSGSPASAKEILTIQSSIEVLFFFSLVFFASSSSAMRSLLSFRYAFP